MTWLIKWVSLALAAFAVYTAEPEQKEAMFNGVKAFGAALVTACTREGSPCTNAIAWTRAQIASASGKSDAAPSGTADRRRLDPLEPPPAARTDPPRYEREPSRSW